MLVSYKTAVFICQRLIKKGFFIRQVSYINAGFYKTSVLYFFIGKCLNISVRLIFM